MSRQDEDFQSIVPAHLEFLAIYSPDLGATEQTEDDQLVFHYTRPLASRRRKKKTTNEEQAKHNAEAANKRMRQIGLAQGMVNFARTFGGGQDVDTIETGTHRTVLKELENGWWILASIRLTRLPSTSSISGQPPNSTRFEYSSREVSPGILLLEQLLRAHRVFLLHHGRNLNDLCTRLRRSKLCNLLDKYWTRYAEDWEVLLHGNPAAEAYDAIKLAGGGEIGIGVGEEEYGSGEREVLEGLVRGTDGLIDMTVSRFGGEAGNRVASQPQSRSEAASHSYKDYSEQAEIANGVIFAGMGSVSRRSIRTVTDWIHQVHISGEDAYGIRSNPVSERSTRRRPSPKTNAMKTQRPQHEADGSSSMTTLEPMPYEDHPAHEQSSKDRQPTIPPPLVSTIEDSLRKATSSAGATKEQTQDRKSDGTSESSNGNVPSFGTWMNYLTLGYGPQWGINAPQSKSISQSKDAPGTKQDMRGTSRSPPKQHSGSSVHDKLRHGSPEDGTNIRSAGGRYLIGLIGKLDWGADEERNSSSGFNDAHSQDSSNRLLVRTVHVEVDELGEDKQYSRKTQPRPQGAPNAVDVKRVRVVVYEHRPFIYTLLFSHTTPSLAISSFYGDLHKQLQPLHKILLGSTSSSRVFARIDSMVSHHNVTTSQDSRIHDLVYDPNDLSLRSSIPDIPAPLTTLPDPARSPAAWTRLEALSVHTQILATVTDTRDAAVASRERSAKTNRNWWVVWLRVPAKGADHSDQDLLATPSLASELNEAPAHREAILIRRASDYAGGTASARNVSSTLGGMGFSGGSLRFSRLMGGSESQITDDRSTAGRTSSRFAEGIGVDARDYIESLSGLSS